jgi:RNAse (barnase) inhibitor barstar
MPEHDELLKPGVYPVGDPQAWRGRLGTTGVVRVYSVPGSAVTDKKTLLVAVASALDFPDYFGGNWDALLDCLRDMGWTDADTHVIVVRDAGRMRAACPDVVGSFVDVVQSAIDFHSAHSGAMFLLLEDRAPLGER